MEWRRTTCSPSQQHASIASSHRHLAHTKSYALAATAGAKACNDGADNVVQGYLELLLQDGQPLYKEIDIETANRLLSHPATAMQPQSMSRIPGVPRHVNASQYDVPMPCRLRGLSTEEQAAYHKIKETKDLGTGSCGG